MTNIQIKSRLLSAITNLSDDTPNDMLLHVLEALEALAGADKAKRDRMDKVMKITEEDKVLLLRLPKLSIAQRS